MEKQSIDLLELLCKLLKEKERTEIVELINEIIAEEEANSSRAENEYNQLLLLILHLMPAHRPQ